jgi:arylsulfatase A-like enzyme
VLKDDAVDFIEDAAKKEDPFFMYIAFNAPHDPRQAPQEYLDRYDVDAVPVPENFLPEYPWKDSINNGPGLRDEALAPYPRTKFAVQKHIQEYYAIISHLDQQVGDMLSALEASGKMENTYIFFTADHGLAVGQHGLIGKQNLYDHSVRVPLMVVGPGIPMGQKRSQDVYLQDVMASSLQLAGVKKPSYVDFNSFLDIVHDPKVESHYNAVYGCYMNVQRMIRKDDYKLLVYPRGSTVFLFDLKNDPNEMVNLADEAAHKDRVNLLFDDLIALQKQMGDELDLSDIRATL